MVLARLFQRESLTTDELIRLVRVERGAVTKQGVYRVLRKLSREEKIVMYRSVISINLLWLMQLDALISKKAAPKSIIGDLDKLKEREKISLKVRGLTGIDQVWTDIFLNIEKHVQADVPLYLFNPHNWFTVLREETDMMHVKHLLEERRPVFLTLGSRTPLEKVVKKIVEYGDDIQCAFNEHTSLDRYVTVLDDYLFQIRLSKNDTGRIDSIFKNIYRIPEAKRALQEIDTSISARITIEKSQRKVEQIKKSLSRNFYLRKNI